MSSEDFSAYLKAGFWPVHRKPVPEGYDIQQDFQEFHPEIWKVHNQSEFPVFVSFDNLKE